ncbi:MAG TPA: ferritin family protein [Dehalococcoidales bacterium]|nr:ferritin family protein [Dehalococcoidales bacterium]
MADEQQTTIAALKTSIQMEIDGKEFYRKSAEASTNDLGKQLLKRLSSEEDIHRQVFEKIYKNISANLGWPQKTVSFDSGRRLKSIFAKATAAMAANPSAIPSELDAVQTGMAMENKTYDFYVKHAALASYPGEKTFYEEIAAQEKEHHRILLDYYEFLNDPAAWYKFKEHQMVDGG